MRLSQAVAVMVVAALPVASAAADEHVVSQGNMQFLVNDTKVDALTIKSGDTVVFRNDDRVVHNVFSRTPGFEFDLGSLRRGTSAKHTFGKVGTADIECAIHPHMKLKVSVQP